MAEAPGTTMLLVLFDRVHCIDSHYIVVFVKLVAFCAVDENSIILVIGCMLWWWHWFA